MKMTIKFMLLLCATLAFASNHHVDQGSMVFMRNLEKEKQIMKVDGDGENITNLTKGKFIHLHPVISPNAKEVSFVAGNDDNSLNLMTLNLQSKSLEQWTLPAKNLHPSYSGNGNWITFSTPVDPSKVNQIAYFNTKETRSNSNSTVILSEEGPVTTYDTKFNYIPSDFPSFFPAFSSDASFIIFERRKSLTVKDIVLFNIASKKLTAITDPNGFSMSPSLSFDDRYVAYTSKIENNWDIFVKDRMSGKTFQVTNNVAKEDAPTFTSNNDLIFTSDRNGHSQIFKISFVSWISGIKDEAILVENTNSNDFTPSFSGSRLFSQNILTDFSSPARSSFGAIAHENQIYVVGGHQGAQQIDDENSFLNSVEYYDIKNKTWNKTTPRSVAAHSFSLASFDKYIYAFGGTTYEAANKPALKSINLIERFDTQKEIWEVVGKMPHNRSSYVVVTIGTKAYIIGGWDSTPKTPGDQQGTFHREIDVFDFETGTMTTASFKLPDPLRKDFTAINYNNKIILLGGVGPGASGNLDLLNNVTEIDPDSGISRELKALPFGILAPSAGVIGKELYLFGGMTKMSETEFNFIPHIYSLNLQTNKWIHTGRYLNEAKGFSQIVNVSDKSLGILGGYHYGNDTIEPVSTFELFTSLEQR